MLYRRRILHERIRPIFSWGGFPVCADTAAALIARQHRSRTARRGTLSSPNEPHHAMVTSHSTCKVEITA